MSSRKKKRVKEQRAKRDAEITAYRKRISDYVSACNSPFERTTIAPSPFQTLEGINPVTRTNKIGNPLLDIDGSRIPMNVNRVWKNVEGVFQFGVQNNIVKDLCTDRLTIRQDAYIKIKEYCEREGYSLVNASDHPELLDCFVHMVDGFGIPYTLIYYKGNVLVDKDNVASKSHGGVLNIFNENIARQFTEILQRKLNVLPIAHPEFTGVKPGVQLRCTGPNGNVLTEAEAFSLKIQLLSATKSIPRYEFYCYLNFYYKKPETREDKPDATFAIKVPMISPIPLEDLASSMILSLIENKSSLFEAFEVSKINNGDEMRHYLLMKAMREMGMEPANSSVIQSVSGAPLE